MYCKARYVYTIILLILSACGGGGDSGATNQPTTNDDTQNAELNGFFLLEHDHAAYLLNVSTGKFAEIPNTRWRLMEDIFPDKWATIFDVYSVHADKTEFLVRGYKCDGFSGTNFTCLVVQDYSGNIKNTLVIRDPAIYPLLSPDKQYYSYFRLRYGEPDKLEIRNRSGELISEAQVDSSSVAWLPENRIIYTNGRKFVFTYVNSAVAEYNLTLPDNIIPNGNIGQIAVNPMGEKIAFTLCQDYCKVYIMDVDGAGIRLLASVESGVELGLSNPQWSPDGKWIYIKRGSSGFSTIDYSSKAYMYAVPSSDQGISYILTPNDNIRTNGVIEILRYKNLDNTGELVNETLADTDMYWVP